MKPWIEAQQRAEMRLNDHADLIAELCVRLGELERALGVSEREAAELADAYAEPTPLEPRKDGDA